MLARSRTQAFRPWRSGPYHRIATAPRAVGRRSPPARPVSRYFLCARVPTRGARTCRCQCAHDRDGACASAAVAWRTTGWPIANPRHIVGAAPCAR